MNKINAVTEKDAVVTRLSPLLRSRGYGEPGYEAIPMNKFDEDIITYSYTKEDRNYRK